MPFKDEIENKINELNRISPFFTIDGSVTSYFFKNPDAKIEQYYNEVNVKIEVYKDLKNKCENYGLNYKAVKKIWHCKNLDNVKRSICNQVLIREISKSKKYDPIVKKILNEDLSKHFNVNDFKKQRRFFLKEKNQSQIINFKGHISLLQRHYLFRTALIYLYILSTSNLKITEITAFPNYKHKVLFPFQEIIHCLTAGRVSRQASKSAIEKIISKIDTK